MSTARQPWLPPCLPASLPPCRLPTQPAEVAELIGEEEAGAGDLDALLAGESAEVAAAVRAVLGQFSFQLDAFQAKAVTRLLAGKSGEAQGTVR